jgi:hypothetical protein
MRFQLECPESQQEAVIQKADSGYELTQLVPIAIGSFFLKEI